MKFNQWTLGLAAAGVVSLASAARAEEASHQVMTALASTTLSGYVSTSAIWNFGSNEFGDLVPGRAFDGVGKQDGFNLDVVKVSLGKALEDGDWSAGYQVDLIFGADGAAFDPTGEHIKQAYVALRAPVGNGIDFKMGVWDTIIGYETFDAGSNPNYSRSYGYTIEPIQHTGLLASYQVSEWLGLNAGVADTGYGTINARSGHDTTKTYMGSAVLTAPDSTGFLAGSVLTLGFIDSGIDGASDTQNYYAGLTFPTPIEGLNLGASFDLRKDGGSVVGVPNVDEEMAIGLYASYQASEKLRINGRAEWAQADGKVGKAGIGGSGLEEAIGLTLTLDYALWENVLSRLEVRYDNADLVVPKAGGFNSGSSDDAISLALNVIYKF